MSDTVLRHFGVSPDDLIGQGGEARVYALDEDRVLRLCHGEATAYVEKRRAFYDGLREYRPPFEVAQILSQGEMDGRSYTVEKRMKGQDFAKILHTLNGRDREKALTSYLDVAEQIGTIRFPDAPFGEMLTDTPIQCDSWPDFLKRRIEEMLRLSRTDVEADVPRFDTVETCFSEALGRLDGMEEKSLVHGDYFPGNVFIDDDLTISGVGDFSGLTVVGDPRMDLAGAVAYVEVVDSYRPDDTAFLLRLVTDRHGEAILPILALYRLYYSLFFTVCKADDPEFYAWCIENLRLLGGECGGSFWPRRE